MGRGQVQLTFRNDLQAGEPCPVGPPPLHFPQAKVELSRMLSVCKEGFSYGFFSVFGFMGFLQ